MAETTDFKNLDQMFLFQSRCKYYKMVQGTI